MEFIRREADNTVAADRTKSGVESDLHSNQSDNSPAAGSSSPVDSFSRQIICADALKWLEGFDDNAMKGCVFTSLPDLTEVQTMFRLYRDTEKIAQYRKWFTDTVALILRKMAVGSYAIFLQSDVRHTDKRSIFNGWTDKAHLCSTAADREGCVQIFHKIVLTVSLKARTEGRPGYSHLVCYFKPRSTRSTANNITTTTASYALSPPETHSSSGSSSSGHHSSAVSKPPSSTSITTTVTYANSMGVLPSDSISMGVLPPPPDTTEPLKPGYRSGSFPTPDVFERGDMLWPRAIGLDCCLLGVAFIKEVAKASCVFDPFCGLGTVCAMANAVGIRSIGVELSAKRCRRARTLDLAPWLKDLDPRRRRFMGLSDRSAEELGLRIHYIKGSGSSGRSSGRGGGGSSTHGVDDVTDDDEEENEEEDDDDDEEEKEEEEEEKKMVDRQRRREGREDEHRSVVPAITSAAFVVVSADDDGARKHSSSNNSPHKNDPGEIVFPTIRRLSLDADEKEEEKEKTKIGGGL